MDLKSEESKMLPLSPLTLLEEEEEEEEDFENNIFCCT
jgi:hypothetical protein